MKPATVTYIRPRTASERALVLIELDRVRTPDEALARKLITKSRASEVAAEFRAARRTR